ncbi:MAG: hypothetical protein M3516_09095 [Actinomycetota bacterium]|nr:hypothetical protein [Actinomycetota bacterium]
MERQRPEDDETAASVARWGFAALVAFAALVGTFALAAMFVITFEMPDWLQWVLGIGLPLGAAILAWLIASALTSASHKRG